MSSARARGSATLPPEISSDRKELLRIYALARGLANERARGFTSARVWRRPIACDEQRRGCRASLATNTPR